MSEKSSEDKKRDEVLRRMLNSPAKEHKSMKKKEKSGRTSKNSQESG